MTSEPEYWSTRCPGRFEAGKQPFSTRFAGHVFSSFLRAATVHCQHTEEER